MTPGHFAEYFQKVKIRGYVINYVKLGSGPIRIFCFPGILASLRHYGDKLIKKFAKEGDGSIYTFYIWDIPGYFESKCPVRKLEDISLDVDAEIGIELIKSFSEPFQWVLMGWCGGAHTAIKIATEHPDMVEKLVVWATWEILEDVQLFQRTRDLTFTNDSILANRLLIHRFSYFEYEKHYHAWMNMLERVYFNLDRSIYCKEFTGVKCPTLIIAGTDDHLFPVGHMQYLHQHIQNSRLEILQGAPHFMHSTHYEEMYALIHPFLQKSTKTETYST